MGAPVHQLFVSGRLCLFGEHSDWAGEHRTVNEEIPVGLTLVVGTLEGVFARAHSAKEQTFTVSATNNDGEIAGPKSFPLSLKDLAREAQAGGFWSYAAGAAYSVLQAHGHVVGGLVLDNYRTTLPMSKGLSSSAAICVMVVRAFSTVYGLGLDTLAEMELAYRGETATPSKCGRMDQVCAVGSRPSVMTFDGPSLKVEPLRLAAPLHLVLVDLRAAKDTTAILAALQQAYPQPGTDAHRALHRLLGDLNHQVVGRAAEAMAAGDVAAVGAVMTEAQALFDAYAAPLCPQQLTAPVLHKVLSYPPLLPLVWGGKGVGSQGDGTAQLLTRGPQEQQEVCALVARELGMACMPLTVEPTHPATHVA